MWDPCEVHKFVSWFGNCFGKLVESSTYGILRLTRIRGLLPVVNTILKIPTLLWIEQVRLGGGGSKYPLLGIFPVLKSIYSMETILQQNFSCWFLILRILWPSPLNKKCAKAAVWAHFHTIATSFSTLFDGNTQHAWKQFTKQCNYITVYTLK